MRESATGTVRGVRWKATPFENGRVRVLPWSGRPAGRVCVVRVQQSGKRCVCVTVYKSERVQPVIAACSYFLKHNGAGAVIIFGLEWLINF